MEQPEPPGTAHAIPTVSDLPTEMARMDGPAGPPPNLRYTAPQDGPLYIVQAELVHSNMARASPGQGLNDHPVGADLGVESVRGRGR